LYQPPTNPGGKGESYKSSAIIFIFDKKKNKQKQTKNNKTRNYSTYLIREVLQT
jgi:hypothetical protein